MAKGNGWRHNLLFARASTIHVNSACPSSTLAMAKGKRVELLLSMGGSVKVSQSKKVVWPSSCEASKHMDEDGKVADTLEGADPSSLANKVAVEPEQPAPELTKENASSQEQIQVQDGLDDALKRRLQQLIESNRVMLFMKGTPEDPKCEFSKIAVNMLKEHEVEFGSFDLLTDNEVMEGIQKYSNWPLLPHIYFEGRACGFRHIGTLMKGCPSDPTVFG